MLNLKRSPLARAVSAASSVTLAVILTFLSAGVSEATVSTISANVNTNGSWALGSTVRVTDQTTYSYESNNVPGCCLDLRFYAVDAGYYYCSGYNMRLGWYPIIGGSSADNCTRIIRGTRFKVGYRNSVIRAGEDPYFTGRLFH